MKLTFGKSYAIVSKSEFLTNIVTEYLYTINEQKNIFRNRSLYGKFIKFSNTEYPSNKWIVFSTRERLDSDEIETIDIDNNLVEVCFSMYNLDTEQYKLPIKYLKQKTKKLEPEIAYYYICAVIGQDRIDTDTIDRVIERKHTGVYTTTEMVSVVIDFINSPSEVNLFRLISTLNDYQRVINTISMLTNDTPQWVYQKFGNVLDSTDFVKSLLKIALIAIKAENSEAFIVHCLKELIY